MDALKLLQAGKIADAIAQLNSHLSKNPDDTQILLLLARVLANQGVIDKAIPLLRKITEISPNHGEAHFGIAELERTRGNSDAAKSSYEKAIRYLPNDPIPPYNFATLLHKMGFYNEGRLAYEEALNRNPKFAEAIINLGNVDFHEKKFDSAEARYKRALEINGALPQVHHGLGLIAERRGEIDSAEYFFRKAIALNPQHPSMSETYNSLGNVLFKKQRYQEALVAFQKSLQLYGGDYPLATDNLIATLMLLRCFPEILTIATQALKNRPDDPNLLVERLFASLNLCEWENLDDDVRIINALPAESLPDKVGPFHSIAFPGLSRHQHHQMTSAFVNKHLDLIGNSPLPKNHSNRPKENQRLRIGYLSADFHEHATSYLLIGVLEQHDKNQFEIFGYSCGPNDSSVMRKRVIDSFDTFRDISSLNDHAAAQQIQNDHIDILIDLKGWTEAGRPEILAYRPAPLQVCWLGYPGTIGKKQLADYIIGDQIVTPIEHSDTYTESLALMPNSYQPNDRSRIVGKKPSRTEAGLPETGLIFCSFNQSYKFNPLTFDQWCRLLRSVDGSVLWLLDLDRRAKENLLREAKARGVNADRVIFAERQPVDAHLGRLQLADLALDTYPCNSHTTATDALWVGVPIVTCIGETFASRVAASLLQSVGMPELITNSLEEYFSKILLLATNKNLLKTTREKLIASVPTADLFNTIEFTRDLERLYKTMLHNLIHNSIQPIALRKNQH